MKKTFVVFTVLIAFSGNLFSQTPESENTENASQYEFSLSYAGVSMLMEDLETYDKVNYDLLLPKFERIQAKRKKAFTVGAVVLGLGLVVSSAGAYLVDTAEPFEEETKHDIGSAMGGLGLLGMAGGVMTAMLMQPKEDDFYRLVNTYNRSNPEKQIRVRREVHVY